MNALQTVAIVSLGSVSGGVKGKTGQSQGIIGFRGCTVTMDVPGRAELTLWAQYFVPNHFE